MRTSIKKLVSLLALTAGALSLSASTVYLAEDLKTDKVEIPGGMIFEKKDDISQMNGFRKKGSNEIFATKKLSLKVADVKDASLVKVKKDGDIQEVTLALNIAENKLVEDQYDAWEAKEDLFLEKCSQCHAAPDAPHHTMLEWEGLYVSMKGFAQPTPQEEKVILQYLKIFAKDGIIKLEE